MTTPKNWKKEIRQICTYYSEPDEISGKDTAGTAGYDLSEKQFGDLFDFISHNFISKSEIEEILKEQEKINFAYHGRSDCKSCSLVEIIKSKLTP